MGADPIPRLRELLDDHVIDCGDSSCAFARKRGGMRTNGGCRCLNGERMGPLPPGTRGVLGQLWKAAPALLDEIEALRKVAEAAGEMRDSATTTFNEDNGGAPRCGDCGAFYEGPHNEGCSVAAFDAALSAWKKTKEGM